MLNFRLQRRPKTIEPLRAVLDLSGELRGVYPSPLVDDDPLTGDCKVWSGRSHSTPSERPVI